MRFIREAPVSKAVTAVLARFHKLPHKTVHKVHHVAHMSYLGAASLEAHGIYSYCAAGLLVVTIVSLLSGEEVEA